MQEYYIVVIQPNGKEISNRKLLTKNEVDIYSNRVGKKDKKGVLLTIFEPVVGIKPKDFK